MPNDQAHDTRTTNPANRLAQAVSLSVASRPADGPNEPVPQGVIFSENFDAQPDWTSTMHSTSQAQIVEDGDVLPENWYYIYQSTEWSPETGYPNNHASLEIKAVNSDKALGGTGKSAVVWRESVEGSPSEWKSDSNLGRVIQGTSSLYVEFKIRFSDNWWQRNNFASWASKMFRIMAWDGVGNIFSGYQGAIGPIFIWNYKRDEYGVRNASTMRGGPYGENYESINSFAGSRNYTDMTAGQAPGGTDPQVPDLVNGGYLVDYNGAASHDQVFGPTATWTKMGFYVQMNSAPGVADGVFKQWVNDQRILNIEDIPWVGPTDSEVMPKWNVVGIGGNHNFYPFPDTDRYEDWYSIDELVARTDLPEGLE